jgi:hypothetical protein
MVSIYSGAKQAYWLLANISPAGACVVSGVHFEPGTKVLLRIGLDRDAPFSTESKVVWSRDESQADRKRTFYHGLQFAMMSHEQRSELQAILSGPSYRAPAIPGQPSAENGLDAMLVDLNEELGRLASKLSQDNH